MPTVNDDLNIFNAGVAAIPAIVGLINSIHKTANPGAPPLTSDQLIQILLSLGAQTIATDEAIKAAHASGS